MDENSQLESHSINGPLIKGNASQFAQQMVIYDFKFSGG